MSNSGPALDRRTLLASLCVAVAPGCTASTDDGDDALTCRNATTSNFETEYVSIQLTSVDAVDQGYECTVDVRAAPGEIEALRVRTDDGEVVSTTAVTSDAASTSWIVSDVPSTYDVTVEATVDGETVDRAAVQFDCDRQ